MAAGVSGSVAFTSSGKTLRVYYAQTFTPGVAQSTVTITKVTLQSDVSLGTTRFFFDGKIIVNGEVVFSRSVSGSNGGVTLDGNENTINLCTNGIVTVNHSAATSISIQLEKNTYSWPYFYCSYADDFTISAGSRTITLAAIPMASAISAGAVTLGSEMSVSLTKAADGMTDTVTWQCGSQSGTIAEDSSLDTFTWTPPVSLASQAPDSTSVSITLTTATKNGDTDAGTSSVTVSCQIPEDVRPTASLAVSDETGYLDAFGSYIRSQSKARVVTTAAGAYGSSITGISVTCGTLTGSGSSLLFSLPNAGTVSIFVTVTDSRGRTAAVELQIYVTDYSPPVPGITALYRCDASGNAAADGAWAKAELGCAVTSLSGQNTAACVLKYRVRGTESWTEMTVTAPGCAVFAADTGSDYQVQLTASDSFTAVSSDTALLPAAFALLDFDRKNKAAGIGQRAGTAGTLSVGLPIKMGAHRITDLGAPTDSTDAATKGYVDTAAAAAKSYADTAAAKAVPTNLLDNSDFTHLIAQAGYMGLHGTTTYFADRWFPSGHQLSYDSDTRTITFSPDGLSIINQYVGCSVVGKTLTIAIKASSADGTVSLTDLNAQSGHADVPIYTGITVHTFVGGEKTGVRFFSSCGGSIVVDWIALYEGEYTAETLPEYHPKGYAVELAECQRYFQQSKTFFVHNLNGGGLRTQLYLPGEMRISPSVSINGSIYAAYDPIAVSLAWYSIEKNALLLALSVPDLSLFSVGMTYNASIDVVLSADL